MSKVTTTGWGKVEARVLKRLNGLGEASMMRALTRVGEDVTGQYRAAIAAGRSPAGKFAKLSEPYATQKAKKHGAQPILVATGAMRDSLGFKLTVLGPGRYRLECGAGGVDASGVSNGDKALWHINGTGSKTADSKAKAKQLRDAAKDEAASDHADKGVVRGLRKKARDVGGGKGMPARDFGRLPKALLRKTLSQALRAEVVAAPASPVAN